MGKGDGRRPAAISDDAFEANYNRIFRSGPKCDCHKHEHQVCDICQGVAWRCETRRSHGLCNTLNAESDETCGACGSDRSKGRAL